MLLKKEKNQDMLYVSRLKKKTKYGINLVLKRSVVIKALSVVML